MLATRAPRLDGLGALDPNNPVSHGPQIHPEQGPPLQLERARAMETAIPIIREKTDEFAKQQAARKAANASYQVRFDPDQLPPDDLLALGSIVVTAAEGDGTTVSGTVSVSVSDDVPTINVLGDTSVVEGATANGTWSQSIGADQPGARESLERLRAQ